MLPTVITDIKDESCCMKDEIFGPVTCVVPFDSEEEVIKRANSVKYGLAATVWSSNVGRIHRVAKKLQSGLVWTNCWLIRELNLPFGGMKSSGVGREGAKDSYEFFTEVKTITIKHWPCQRRSCDGQCLATDNQWCNLVNEIVAEIPARAWLSWRLSLAYLQ